MAAMRETSPDPWGSKTADSPDEIPLMVCEDCNSVYNGACPKHPYEHVRHTPAPLGDMQRPIKSLPNFLFIAQSTRAPPTFGVYTSQAIPARTVFGPYEGVRVDDTTQTSPYTWQLPGTGKPYRVDEGPPVGRWGDGIPYLVDGRPLGQSNWMRYVKAAQNEDEQNLAVFTGFDGHIYYRVRYEIPAGGELLVRKPGRFFVWQLGDKCPPDEEDVIPDGVVHCETCKKLRLGSKGQCHQCREERENGDQCCSSSDLERSEAAATPEGAYVNENAFSCKSCDKSFSTRKGLHGHMRVHVKCRLTEDSHEQSCLAVPAPVESPSSKTVLRARNHGLRRSAKRDGVEKQQLVPKLSSRPDFKAENNCRRPRVDVAETCEKAGNARRKVKTCANQAVQGDGLRKSLVVKHVDFRSLRLRDPKYSVAMNRIVNTSSIASSVSSRASRTGNDKQRTVHVLGRARSGNGLFRAFTNGMQPSAQHNGPQKSRVGQRLNTKKRSLVNSTKNKLYSCHMCGKHFGRTDHLKRHVKSHKGSKPYSCNVCGARFSRRDHARRHQQLVHANVKVHGCPVCKQNFSRVDGVKKHLAIHAGDKPYPCSVCGKQFTRSDHVKRHLASHVGYKPYTCSVCGKRFRRKDHVKRHTASHSNGEVMSS